MLQTLTQGVKQLSGATVGDFIFAERVHNPLDASEDFFGVELGNLDGESAPELAASEGLRFRLMTARILGVMAAVGTVAKSDAPAAVSGNEDVAAVLHIGVLSKRKSPPQ